MHHELSIGTTKNVDIVQNSQCHFKIPVTGLSGKLKLTFEYYDIKSGLKLTKDKYIDVLVSRDFPLPTHKVNNYYSETPKMIKVLSNNIGHSNLPFPGPFVYMTWICSEDKHLIPNDNIMVTIKV